MPAPARMTVFPPLPGAHAIPSCGAKLRLGWCTRAPKPGVRLSSRFPVHVNDKPSGQGIGANWLSVLPESRTERRPYVKVTFGGIFRESRLYHWNRLSYGPPQAKPNAGVAVEHPKPFPK